MATIRKRGSSWQAQVRREGFPPISKSFLTKAEAAAWAREKEAAIDRAELPTNTRDLTSMTVADLPKSPSGNSERPCLGAVQGRSATRF
jgi:hypothetical protein